MEPFLGQIIMFGGNFAPRGWALCDGSLIAISQNSALFSILGTTYGGDGRTTFGLPDLRGRVPMHAGRGPALSNRSLGSQTGTETVTLNATEMPTHQHGGAAGAVTQSSDRPGAELAAAPGGSYGPVNPVGPAMAASQPAGGNMPHNNMQPSLAVNFIIALVGIFPSRN